MIKVEPVQNRRYLLLLQLSLSLHLFPEKHKTRTDLWPLRIIEAWLRLYGSETQENDGKVKKILPCEPFQRRFWLCWCHGGLTPESVFINLNFLNFFFFVFFGFCFGLVNELWMNIGLSVVSICLSYFLGLICSSLVEAANSVGWPNLLI